MDFVNLSFGVHGLVEHYLTRGFGLDYAAAVESLARTDGKVLVIAADNSNGHHP